MTEQNQDCRECAQAYDGADNVLRCRVSSAGGECNEVRALLCREFVREAGADAVESTRGWCEK